MRNTRLDLLENKIHDFNRRASQPLSSTVWSVFCTLTSSTWCSPTPRWRMEYDLRFHLSQASHQAVTLLTDSVCAHSSWKFAFMLLIVHTHAKKCLTMRLNYSYLCFLNILKHTTISSSCVLFYPLNHHITTFSLSEFSLGYSYFLWIGVQTSPWY